ncbi:MAG TPA: hypothetical protein VFX59_01250 [Polyangiales bacterium]|nr:hypothetical protein [Polyangiales bacterium]
MKWLVLVLLALPGRVLAHGAPPAATEAIASDERGVSLVRVSRGLAYRAAEGFRFLCPEAWDGNLLVRAASLPGGPTILASDSLFVLQEGRVTRHPVQSGLGFALASHRDAVFGVFRQGTSWELRRITASANELVRALAQPVDALAALDDELALLRFVDRTVTVDRYALSGEPRGGVSWEAKSFVAEAALRVAGEQLYAVLWAHSAPWLSVGRVGKDAFEPLREANVSLDGPIASSLAIDGVLQDLQTGTAIDTQGDRISCLGETSGQPYACARGGLLRVDANGLGAPLFELSALREPDLSAVPDAARADCTVRWTDLVTDGVPVSDAGMPAPDAGATARTSTAEGCATRDGRGFEGALLLVALASRRRRH